MQLASYEKVMKQKAGSSNLWKARKQIFILPRFLYRSCFRRSSFLPCLTTVNSSHRNTLQLFAKLVQKLCECYKRKTVLVKFSIFNKKRNFDPDHQVSAMVHLNLGTPHIQSGNNATGTQPLTNQPSSS